nr:transposase [Paenibacillus thermoaerophilus]
MLTKVIIYAYTQRLYSSRQIAKAVRENIMFMWLAGRRQEDAEHDGADLLELGESSELTADRLEQAVQRLEEKLQEKPKDKPLKKAVRLPRKDLLPRLQKYEHQETLFGERNSFSKTDPDATFMRMKEDHMRNGQLKPGYNVQIGTENQFVLGYSVHQRPTDTRCLKPHLEKVKEKLGKLPGTVIADAGYGSEENYAYLEEEHIHALVKYGTYHKEKSRAWKKDIGRSDNWSYNWSYNEEEDSWTCAAGQKLTFHYESKTTTESGYEIRTRHYRSANCEGCPLKAACTKAKGNREISVSLTYWRQKKEMRERLQSEDVTGCPSAA